MKKMKVFWKGFLFLTCLLFFARTLFAGVAVTGQNFGDNRWLTPEDEIRITLDKKPDPKEGRLAVVIGSMDVTSQLHFIGKDIIYKPRLLPLPSGEQEVVLYLVKGSDEWEEISRLPLKVLTKGGFIRAEMKPHFTVNLKSQLVEDRSSGAKPPERSTPFTDLAFEGGMTTQHEKPQYNIQSNFNLVGSTFQGDALRFFEQGDSAPKLDLSEYLLQGKVGRGEFLLGHVEYGTHRHLLDSVRSRGAVFKYQFLERFDFSCTSVQGRSIVGWDNIIGLSDPSSSSINAANFGVELIKDKPGTLRFETMYLYGTLQPEPGFNRGEIVDSERSHGFGFRLIADSLWDRLSADFSFARSAFNNPDDPQLSQGVELVDVEEAVENAHYLEVDLDILKHRKLWGERSLSLKISGVREQLDPQFKSLGAFTLSDFLNNEISANCYIADVNFRVKHAWTEDNLDDIASILKTKGRNLVFSIDVPLPYIVFPGGGSPFWLPNLNASYNRIHQFGVNTPAGFDLSRIPDQINTIYAAGSDWNGDTWKFSYQFFLAFQDNLQPGREKSDFKDLTHMIIMSFWPKEGLALDLILSQTDAETKEIVLKRTTRSLTLSPSWQFLPKWSFLGSFSITDDSDNQDQSTGENFDIEAQLAKQFQWPSLWDRKLPGSVFLRFNLLSDRFADNTFDLFTDSQIWTVNFGLSVSYK